MMNLREFKKPLLKKNDIWKHKQTKQNKRKFLKNLKISV